MTINDLIKMYEAKKNLYGVSAYKYISQVLTEAKEQHKNAFFQSKTALNALKAGKMPDHEQSWKSFKGKGLEKLVEHIIQEEVKKVGLAVVNGGNIAKTKAIEQRLLLDFGQYGSHLPDVDLIIYKPQTYKVIAILSSKVTLRERVSQTSYWKLKLESNKTTEHIKVFFITPDEDGTLTQKTPAKKGRAIVEIDTDGCYVLSETDVEESDKVKIFDKFITDLKKLL
jgi:type II restriction enzyme